MGFIIRSPRILHRNEGVRSAFLYVSPLTAPPCGLTPPTPLPTQGLLWAGPCMPLISIGGDWALAGSDPADRPTTPVLSTVLLVQSVSLTTNALRL